MFDAEFVRIVLALRDMPPERQRFAVWMILRAKDKTEAGRDIRLLCFAASQAATEEQRQRAMDQLQALYKKRVYRVSKSGA